MHLAAHMLPEKMELPERCAEQNPCPAASVSLEEQAARALPFLAVCSLWLALAGLCPLSPAVLRSRGSSKSTNPNSLFAAHQSLGSGSAGTGGARQQNSLLFV